MFSDHSHCRQKGQHIQIIRRPTGQTSGSVQNWCHVKGHEPWLEAARWNTSLKARPKGQRGCDLFWSAATANAPGVSWKSLNPASWKGWGVCWNETFGAIPDRLLQCWRARRSRECSQAAKRGTEETKEGRQQSKMKRTACRVSRWHRSLFSRTMLVLSFDMKRDKRAAFCCPNISNSDTVGAVAEPSPSDLLEEDSLPIRIIVILCYAFCKL